jgi:selenocysteine-specific elongation factor
VLDDLLRSGDVLALGEKLLLAEAVEEGRRRLREILDRFHAREPLKPAAGRAWVRDRIGVEDAVFDLLVSRDAAVEPVEGGRIRRAGYAPEMTAEQKSRLDGIAAAIEEAEFATPREDELPDLVGAHPDEAARLLDILIDEGRVVRLTSGVVLSSAALEKAREAIATFIRENGAMGPADLKAVLGMSRKYSIPLFEYLDSVHFTVRQGDRRVLA